MTGHYALSGHPPAHLSEIQVVAGVDRSGTGKTTVIMAKVLQKEQEARDALMALEGGAGLQPGAV
jgi:hypothetical protein